MVLQRFAGMHMKPFGDGDVIDDHTFDAVIQECRAV